MTNNPLLRVQVFAAAAKEIVAQADYYTAQSSESLAEQWSTAVDETVQSLRTMAERGAPCWFFAPPHNELRRVPIGSFENFLLFYRVDAEMQVLTIYAVLHSARNVARLIALPRN